MLQLLFVLSFFSETNFAILISYFSVFPSSFSSFNIQHSFFANQFKFYFIYFFASTSHLMCFYPFDGNVNVTIKTWHGIHLLSKKTDIFTYNISQFTFFLPPSPSYCCSLTYNQPKKKYILYVCKLIQFRFIAVEKIYRYTYVYLLLECS